MEILNWALTNIGAFVAVLTVLVFVHEMGHYLAARRCGVRIEVFSVGFGPEIVGRTDKAGTRWKFSAIPVGGYVRMYGEREPDAAHGDPPMHPDDRAVSFFAKPLRQRAWIVFAGPLANFLFAIVVLAGLFALVGQPYTPADIAKVEPGSAAEKAGIKPGDLFVRIDGVAINRFEQVRRLVQLAPGREIEVVVRRDGRDVALTAVPEPLQVTEYGTTQTIGRLGVSRSARDMVLKRADPATAVWLATQRTAALTGDILDALGQILFGERSSKELGGPVRIAQLSGEMAQAGLVMIIQFAAVLSINLGLINLFPIPILDGGHLAFYAVEALRGRPLGERAMGYSLNFGLALILSLTLYVTWNDLDLTAVLKNILKIVA